MEIDISNESPRKTSTLCWRLPDYSLFGTSYHETPFQLYRILFKISVVFFTFDNLNLDDFSDERAKEGGGEGERERFNEFNKL